MELEKNLTKADTSLALKNSIKRVKFCPFFSNLGLFKRGRVQICRFIVY